MARKTYSEEFKRDAVALCESTSGATIRSIVEDLGINRSTLSTWLNVFGTGTRTNATGDKVAGPIPATNGHRSDGEELSDAERIRVLERENAYHQAATAAAENAA